MNSFPDLFYTAAVFAAIAAALAVCIQGRTDRHAAVVALTWPLMLVYLIGMHRVGGVDFDSYETYLSGDTQRDPDIGYRLLMQLANSLGMQLSEILLVQGLFTLGAVYLLSRKLQSDFVITIALYILHAAVVRDFSQSRAALALAIYFVGLAQSRRSLYLVFTLLAVSVHLTLVPLVLTYHWARLAVNARRGQVLLVALPAIGLLAGVTLMLSVLSGIDPRIDTYMNWAQDLYGNPVGSYSTLALYFLIGAVCYRAYRLTGDENCKAFVIMMLYAATTFVAFRYVAIFAFRLSNVVAALYPFAVGHAIRVLKEREHNRLHDIAVPLALVGALLLAVLVRPGSLDILKATAPSLLAN